MKIAVVIPLQWSTRSWSIDPVRLIDGGLGGRARRGSASTRAAAARSVSVCARNSARHPCLSARTQEIGDALDAVNHCRRGVKEHGGYDSGVDRTNASDFG